AAQAEIRRHTRGRRSSHTLLSDRQRLCRNMVSPRGSADIEGATLSMFAGLLGMALDRPVVDKTGITSFFEIPSCFRPIIPRRSQRIPAHPPTLVRQTLTAV